MNKIEDIHEFKLPIHYCSKKNDINNTICEDIELHNIKSNEGTITRKSLYNNVFLPKTEIGLELLDAWNKTISYDKNTLNVVKNFIKK